ncbi:NAD(P)-dependent alcohol dehydrogenase [Yeosuana marina]|uniref:NAD(P)-dependent alcohol dehydrogenase n=1 Tax=Yeosuana marina TaxID=1565536 RepID=UPI0014248F98|nr:NAD(P)-dependent alcohol dehydrogenase [Yeosuana marina]
MKAIIYKRYGEPNVLKLVEIKKPTLKPNEVLVKVIASSVTSVDIRLRKSDFPLIFWLLARIIFGLFGPRKKILGHEFSGVIIEKGNAVTKFKLHDEVFGTTTMLKSGSYAEYVCIPERWKFGVIQHKPRKLNHLQSATIPIGSMTAMYLFEKSNLEENQVILIYGASGSVGSYAIQIAKAKGAFVFAVCSASNFEMVKSLGADLVIDYRKEKYYSLNRKVDVVFDAVGKTTKLKAKRILKKGGSFISVKMVTKEKNEHLSKIKFLIEEEKLKPYIDKSYKFEDIVEAHQYVDKGHKKGNVAIQISNDLT